MKKLDEGIQDLINLDGETTGGTSDSLLLLGGSKKKKPKASRLQLPPQQQQPIKVVSSQIVIPQSLADVGHNQVVEKLVSKQAQNFEAQKAIEKKNRVKKTIKKAVEVKQKVNQLVNDVEIKQGVLTPDKKQQLITQLVGENISQAEYQEVSEVFENLADADVNIPVLVEEIGEAISAIPDAKDIELEDIEIVPSKINKDKTGYYKTKVNIKKSNIPSIINKIASYIKQQSKGIIKPRVCDLRVIGNTNKTQLRNSSLKLSSSTVVFKPDTNKLKVNKGTRFMISVPENFESTGNLLVYLQESRAKTILELTPRDFPNVDTFCEFIGDRIAEYYYHGFDVTLKKLELRNTNNVLMPVISQILNTRDYKAKPYVDSDNHLFAVDFISNGDENQWLRVQIREANDLGMYEIVGLNMVTSDEYNLIQQNVTLQWLEQNLLKTLNTAYSRDWSKELNSQDGLSEFYYMLGKLKHFKLRKVMSDMFKIQEEQPELNIEILKTFSRKDMVKLQKNDYDAEAIIGKTSAVEYFVLTYLAYPIVGGDKRKGREYITTDKYYDTYSVSDRRQYQKREKTVIKKEGAERNYNARPYLFQLEYSINNGEKKNICRCSTFTELLERTKFLSNNPQTILE